MFAETICVTFLMSRVHRKHFFRHVLSVLCCYSILCSRGFLNFRRGPATLHNIQACELTEVKLVTVFETVFIVLFLFVKHVLKTFLAAARATSLHRPFNYLEQFNNVMKLRKLNST